MKNLEVGRGAGGQMGERNQQVQTSSYKTNVWHDGHGLTTLYCTSESF